jgi:ABC-2 type transport system permease protein|tara:strand:+ start:1815 stop:2528 length:714 start_codon:yes stop_codon:yes gene_type:complete
MHNTLTIFNRELKSFFDSPMAYVFLIVFSLLNGWFFTTTFFLYGQSDLRTLFNIVPLVYLFFIPGITMGLISREKGLGTIEILSTLPIDDRDIVVGKYLSAVALIAMALFSTSLHFLTLSAFGNSIDYGAVFTGYLGLLLVGSVYASVGMFSSAVTDNQVISFIVGIAIIFVFWLFDKVLIFMPGFLAGTIQYLSVEYHLSNISRGVIDTRNLIYFGSVIGFFLFLTTRLVESRRWS